MINLKSIRRYEVVEADDFDNLYQEYAASLDRETLENEARLSAESELDAANEEVERLESYIAGLQQEIQSLS